MTSPNKKPPVKARVMWACPGIVGIMDRKRTIMDSPVFVLPATQEAYDAMEEQCASMIFVPLTAPKGDTNRIARSVLAAIGIHHPKPPVNDAGREEGKTL